MKEHLNEKCIAVFNDTEGHTLEIWSQPEGTVLRTFTKGSFTEFVVEKNDMKLLIDKLRQSREISWEQTDKLKLKKKEVKKR